MKRAGPRLGDAALSLACDELGRAEALQNVIRIWFQRTPPWSEPL